MHSPTKVAIQGDPGSFHEIAALQYYAAPIELVYCDSFDHVFNLLSARKVHKAFVAVTNSRHGLIQDVATIVASFGGLKKGGTHILPIDQHLIGLPTATAQGIRTIVSHPVALSQCSIEVSLIAGATTMTYHDTSAAVAYVKASNDPTIVAIASEQAAKLHGLTILKRCIQDDPNNATTFQSYSL